jgi:hypothetical protein
MGEKAMPLEQGWPKAGPNSLPLPSNLIGVPPIRQCQDFTCGVAATLMLLRYWCVDGCADVEESALYEPLQTTRIAGGTTTRPGARHGTPDTTSSWSVTTKSASTLRIRAERRDWVTRF